MKLLGSNKIIIILCIGLFFFKSSHSEDTVDIWKKNSQEKSISKISPKTEDKNNQNKINYNKENSNSKNIEINESLSKSTLEVKLYGIFDPDQNNLSIDIKNYAEFDILAESEQAGI